ncbi:hypothetical protein OHU25_49975 [Streptomyces sp. NBC_00117]|uniref:hypothetical protein n=1 Tax=Streptomyces sp. NBC_00117 TaxID=2975657 RepID=UPI00324A1CCF
MYDKVNWPERYGPNLSALYALNDIDVKAPSEVVWKLLVDAENWSSYFPPEDHVEILSGESVLSLGTKYSRVTVGFPIAGFPPRAYFAACARLIASRCASPGRFFGCCPRAALAAFCAGGCPTSGA